MPSFRLSRRAEADLRDIASHTLVRWGEDQAIRYLDELELCCRRLGASPNLGRACDRIKPGLRRIETGRHVIFYRVDDAGVLILRILHQKMLPEGQNSIE